MKERITVKLKERAAGVKTVFTDPIDTNITEGVVQIYWTDRDGKQHTSTFPLTNVLAVEADQL